MERFLKMMSPKANATILDVGGYPSTWESIPIDAQITTLNIHPTEPMPPVNRTIVGDGCNLPYGDKTFDIVFSNSVIEHLGSFERQVAFANEASRVGKALWIQTPARGFFIEPHLLAPFVHYLPKRVQKRLLRHFTLWGILGKPTPADVDAFLSEVRLLSKSELRKLFPDCQILHERFAGLTKSFVAIRLSPAALERAVA
jgi:SAM-dependent methyltransferase